MEALISQLFWLFFIFLALMPMVRQRMLEAERLQMIRRIEKLRGSRVIALIQRSRRLLNLPALRLDDAPAVRGRNNHALEVYSL
jgi:hypothetical protein